MPKRPVRNAASSIDRKYDIAFSLRAPQLQTATAIARKLEPDFTHFIWAERQKELIGSGFNGVDAFKHVFRREAALNVIILSDGWGETKWTRHEQDAIRDRIHDEPNWLSLLVIEAERGARVPNWIGETPLRIDLPRYGRPEAVGIIRARMMELRVATRRQSPAELLEARNAERDRIARQTGHFETVAAWTEVEAEIEKLFRELDRLAAELAATEATVQFSQRPNAWVIVGHERGSVVDWIPRHHSLLRDAELSWAEFNSPLLIQPARISRVNSEEPTHRRYFIPQQDETDTWIWRNKGRDETHTTEQLAEILIKRAVENFFTPRRHPRPPIRRGGGWVGDYGY